MPGTDDELRLAELVAAFSLGTDLGLGQPMEHVLRAWRIAASLGDRIGLDESERAPLYYVALLAWVGCVADAFEVATWFGDDIAFRADSYDVDLSGLPMLGFMLEHVGAGAPVVHRLRLASKLVVTRGQAVQRGLMSHCISTAVLAERIGLGTNVQEPLKQMFGRWDAKGVPAGLGGEDLAFPIRLFHVADIVEVHSHRGGVEAARAIARERRGAQFDPTVVDAFCDHAPELLALVEEDVDWIALIDAEPGLRAHCSEEELDRALEAFADFTDLRSPYFAGHSRAVADLAAEAARVAGCSEDEVVKARRAALVHDFGRNGVPVTILDKPGALTTSERERVRLHPTTRSGCSPGPRCSHGLAPSGPRITSGSTAPDTTAGCRVRGSRRRAGSSRPPTRTTRWSSRGPTARRSLRPRRPPSSAERPAPVGSTLRRSTRSSSRPATRIGSDAVGPAG